MPRPGGNPPAIRGSKLFRGYFGPFGASEPPLSPRTPGMAHRQVEDSYNDDRRNSYNKSTEEELQQNSGPGASNEKEMDI